MANNIINWTHEWNKQADSAGLSIMVRAVYLDPERKGKDQYDVESDCEVNAISVYKWNKEAGGYDCISNIHDVEIAKEILTGYLKEWSKQ